MSTLREYFLLTDATATAKRIPEGDRQALERRLRAARQRAEAADALWANGHTAEGLRLMAEAFGSTLGAAERFAEALGLAAPQRALGEIEGNEVEGSEAEPGTSDDGAEGAPAEPPDAAPAEARWRAALVARGVGGPLVEDVAAADAAVAKGTLPALDDDVTADEGALFQRMVASRNVVDRALTPATLTPAALLRTRLTRLGWATAAAVALIVGSAALLWPTTEESATASGVYNPQFPPSNVIDDDPDTEWLLPDDETGWVDVHLVPPTRVTTLRLRNGHNRNHNDRATQAYRVELYVDGEVARSIEGEWAELERRPSWTEHGAGVDAVERIRVNVLSHHERGAALAEIDWE